MFGRGISETWLTTKGAKITKIDLQEGFRTFPIFVRFVVNIPVNHTASFRCAANTGRNTTLSRSCSACSSW